MRNNNERNNNERNNNERKARICNILNELTVEEFLGLFSESLQDRMSKLGFYVQDGLIYID